MSGLYIHNNRLIIILYSEGGIWYFFYRLLDVWCSCRVYKPNSPITLSFHGTNMYIVYMNTTKSQSYKLISPSSLSNSFTISSTWPASNTWLPMCSFIRQRDEMKKSRHVLSCLCSVMAILWYADYYSSQHTVRLPLCLPFRNRRRRLILHLSHICTAHHFNSISVHHT